jgi:pimeloyl-ACP methyl ester carboxylesterase
MWGMWGAGQQHGETGSCGVQMRVSVAELFQELGAGLHHFSRTGSEQRRQRTNDGGLHDVAATQAVVLVHGWGATVGAFHTGRRHLTDAGWGTIIAHAYRAHQGPVHVLASNLGRTIDAAAARTGGPVHVVGWSLGGIVAHYASHKLAYGDRGLLASVTTICTPHQGARVADRTALLGPFAGAGRELTGKSTTLAALRRMHSERSHSVAYQTIGAERDVVVTDDEARLDGTTHHTISGCGHHTVLERSVTWQHVLDTISSSSTGQLDP